MLLVLPLLFACGNDDDPVNGGEDKPSSGFDTSYDELIKVRTDVPLKAFYKDIFQDGGIHSSSYKDLPAADMLGLSMEYLITQSSDYIKEDSVAQDRAFIGTPDDLNGYLLYPDGAPRFRMIFVNGGNASSHGESLGVEGRRNIKQFVHNGGSYIGSCAGAYVAAIGSDSALYDEYIGIWPSRATNCHLSDSRTDMTIPEDSPLLKYYDFGGDHYISSVYHNGGCCLDEKDCIRGTEVLTRYVYPYDPDKHNHMDGKGAAWAYKENELSGRCIMSGSHPERVTSGEIRDLMAAMIRYALDGQGNTTVKAILHNGETRVMDKVADPAHAKIGDMQCHHFVTWIPEGAKDVKVTLTPKENFNFRLMMDHETFAYYEDADHIKEESNGAPAELTFKNIEPGQWYIGVQCTSKPVAVAGKNGHTYAKTSLLNGVPYSISVSWK